MSEIVNMINHPAHYTSHPIFKGECFDYARHMSFAQGNAFKYLWRMYKKGKLEEDLGKAYWYLKELFESGSQFHRSEIDYDSMRFALDGYLGVRGSLFDRRLYVIGLAMYDVADGDIAHAITLLDTYKEIQ